MVERQEQIIFGVFKGMGDLLCASPVIRAELDRGVQVHLLIFPKPELRELCSLIDFGPNQEHLHLHLVPIRLRDLPAFLTSLRALSPQQVWISPHAPVLDSTWRAPLLLRLIKTLYWQRAEMIGARTERLSWLFDKRIDVERTLPLSLREWAFYRQLRPNDRLSDQPPRPAFLPVIKAFRNSPCVYDLVIHPGAGSQNRIWPAGKYPALLRALPSHWKIAILGLPAELALFNTLSAGRPVDIIVAGSLFKSLEVLASASLLLGMNSGIMHFAEVLGIPTVAIFGQQNPENVIDTVWIDPVYKHLVPCQPCNHAICSQPAIYCLTGIDTASVARHLLTRHSRIHQISSRTD